MPDIGIDLQGFATEEQANAVGREVFSILHVLGKILNLKRLSQVIVAYDYDDALARLDRGSATRFRMSRGDRSFFESSRSIRLPGSMKKSWNSCA